MLKKIALVCDRVVLAALSLLIFCLPFSKAAIETFFGIAFLFWAIKKLAKGDYSLTVGGELNKPMLLFVIMNFISVLFSLDFNLSLKAFFCKVGESIMIYIMVTETINSKKRLKVLGIVVLVSVIMMLADGLAQYIWGADFLRGYSLGEERRLHASFLTWNDFGGWLAIVSVVTLSLLLFAKIKFLFLRIGLAALLLLLLGSLVLTFSRGSWISFMAGVLFMAILKSKGKRLYLAGIFAIVIFLLFCWANINLESAFKRLELWQEALMVINDYPLFGSGLNTYSLVAPKYIITPKTGIYAHNCYLQMAAEIGVGGLLAFFWLMAALFKKGIRSLSLPRDAAYLGILAGIIVFLAHSLVDTHYYSLQLGTLFWFMLGLAASPAKSAADAQS